MSGDRIRAARARAALRTAAALEKACTEMNKFIRACQECDEPLKGIDDGRLLLIESMSEYSGYLDSRFRSPA